MLFLYKMYKPRKETVAQPKKAVVELSDNDFYITILKYRAWCIELYCNTGYGVLNYIAIQVSEYYIICSEG